MSERLANLMRMLLGATNEGERWNAFDALKRAMEAEGIDLHEIGRRVENAGKPDRLIARRRDHALTRVKKLLFTGTVAATVVGCAVEAWLVLKNSDIPGKQTEKLPSASTLKAPMSRMGPGSSEKIVGIDSRDEVREPRLATPQPNPISRLEPLAMAPLEPPAIAAPEPHLIAPPESNLTERGEPAPVTTAESIPRVRQESLPMASAESHSIATPGSTSAARLERTPESPLVNHAAHLGKIADRAGFLFACSNVCYLTRHELQTLSADQLHVVRNEIFARRGRFFRDDVLRSYFLQFLWYRPHAWEVPLNVVEHANVALIQSMEQDNAGLAQSTETPVGVSRRVAGSFPAETKVENGAAVADPSHRYLTAEELQGFSSDQLAIVRNEIFARRGRYFKDEWLRAYFSQFPWYQPYAWDAPLTPIDQANVKLVRSLEQNAAVPRQASRPWRVPPM
jgi:YARHG domain